MSLSDGEFLLSLEERIDCNTWTRHETKRLWELLSFSYGNATDRRRKLRTLKKRRKFLDMAMRAIANKVSARLDPEKSLAEHRKEALRDFFYTQTISKQTLMEMYTSIDKS